MKLYKISGSNEYVEWDVLHNQQGYSFEATNSVTWMSVGDSTHEWGESVQTGYLEPIILRFTNSKGFCLGVYGWHTLSEMALEYGLWPDEAEEEEARSSTLGVSKVAVLEYTASLRPPEIAKMYLVQKELEEGWMDEDTFAERGWEIVPDVPLGELVFVDASGAVVYSVESLNEMTFAPTGYFTIEDAGDVVFVEESPYPARGSLAKSYTPNVTIADGAGIDTGLPYYSQKLYIPVVVWHDENWNLGTDYFGWDLSDASGSVYATNNTGSSRIVISIIVAMIDATDAEVVEVKNLSDAHFHAFKWTSNGVPYWYVVDGDEDWTDDLQADGYEEVPSVVFPTVNTTNDIYHRFRFNKSGSDYTFSARGTTSVYSDSFTNPTYVDWDSTKVYGVIKYYNSDQTFVGRQGITPIEAPSWGEAGKVYMENNSGDSLTVAKIRVATCDDLSCTVVTVYNSSNVAYNAFKYTTNSTDYYYVLDGTQADWTDDLASIGYEEVPAVVLPTVTEIWTLPNNSSGISTIQSGEANTLWKNTPSWAQIPYDATSCYAVAFWRRANNTLGGRTEFSTENISDLLAARNVSSSAIEVYWIKVAVCSSNQASVVTVYNSSNVAYNAFKYTANNTDYYYVLDGVQSDWTDDLASIGYSLTPTAQTAYLNTPNNTQSLPMVGDGVVYTYILYNESGNWLSTSNDYTLVGYHASVDGPLLSFEGTGVYLFKDTTYGRMKITSNGAMRVSIQRIEYTVS